MMTSEQYWDMVTARAHLLAAILTRTDFDGDFGGAEDCAHEWQWGQMSTEDQRGLLLYTQHPHGYLLWHPEMDNGELEKRAREEQAQNPFWMVDTLAYWAMRHDITRMTYETLVDSRRETDVVTLKPGVQLRPFTCQHPADRREKHGRDPRGFCLACNVALWLAEEIAEAEASAAIEEAGDASRA